MNHSWQSLIPLAERSWQSFGNDLPQENLRIVRSEETLESIRTVYRPSLCIVLSGAKQTGLGDTIISYQAGHCLMTSLEVPVKAAIVKASEAMPYLSLSLALDPMMVTELIEQCDAPLQGSGSPFALQRADIPDDLVDPLMRLLTLNFQANDRPVLKPLIEREIIWRLMHSPLSRHVLQVGMKDSHTARIAKATHWLREHYNEPVRVAELAELSRMSVASFHRHFKVMTQMTPVQYQKQIRLQQARQRLLLDHDVATIGFGVGYESASQFSREYRRFFGVSPGQDRKQLQSQAG